MTVGERIKKRREELGLSQGDLAKKMGVSRQAISKAELHDNNITTEKVVKFASALETSEAYLMGWVSVGTGAVDAMVKGLEDTLEQFLPSDEAMEVARAFDDAPAAIQEAVKKLLDVEV